VQRLGLARGRACACEWLAQPLVLCVVCVRASALAAQLVFVSVCCALCVVAVLVAGAAASAGVVQF